MPFNQFFADKDFVVVPPGCEQRLFTVACGEQDLPDVAAKCVFVEPALLAGGGYVQVTRATGAGCRLAAASAASCEEAPFTPHAL